MATSMRSTVNRQRAMLRARKLQLQVKQQETREQLAQVNEALRAMRPARKQSDPVGNVLRTVKVGGR